jgi:hypothetical protein
VAEEHPLTHSWSFHGHTIDKTKSFEDNQVLLATFGTGPGPPGRPSRFPMEIHFVWRFCMGAQGA